MGSTGCKHNVREVVKYHGTYLEATLFGLGRPIKHEVTTERCRECERSIRVDKGVSRINGTICYSIEELPKCTHKRFTVCEDEMQEEECDDAGALIVESTTAYWFPSKKMHYIAPAICNDCNARIWTVSEIQADGISCKKPEGWKTAVETVIHENQYKQVVRLVDTIN